MPKFLKTFTALILALTLIMACAGCGTQSDDSGDESAESGEDGGGLTGEKLTMGYAADDIFSLNYNSEYSFNPMTTTSALNFDVAMLIYEPLVELDENFSLHPRLISSWSSTDGISWRLDISDEYKFADGQTFTVYDAYYTIARAMRSSRYSQRLSCIAGVSIMGGEYLSVTLNEANTQFPALLSILGIRDGQVDMWTPDGCGPYKLSADGKRLTLNNYHPDVQDMPIDVIYLKEYSSADDRITAFEDSLLDLVTNDPTGTDDLGYGGANEIRYINTTNMHFLGFNMESGFFRYANHRAAMNYIVNRTQIVTNVCGGCATAAALPASPLFSLYNSAYAQSFDYSPEKCMQVLENAGIKDMDGDGQLEYLLASAPTDISLIFLVNGDNAVKVSAARVIANSLEDLGITVIMHELSWSDYEEALQAGNYDLYYGEVKMTPDFDPSCLLRTGGSAKVGSFDDPNYETYITNYKSASDDERQMHADLMWQYIISSAPIVTICFEKMEVITHRNVVSGMTPTQSNLFYKFSDWTINLSGE